jgi:hypothetical protein
MSFIIQKESWKLFGWKSPHRASFYGLRLNGSSGFSQPTKKESPASMDAWLPIASDSSLLESINLLFIKNVLYETHTTC